MAPPSMHHQEHHGILGHQHHQEDDQPPVPCPNTKCKGMFITEAKFCIMCGEARPKVKKKVKPSACEDDCVSKDGCRRAVWMFLHGEVKEQPFILRYAHKYEIFAIFLVIYLVLADIIVSIPSIGRMSKGSTYYLDFEGFIYAVFTAEYVLRLWSSMESRQLAALGSIRGRLQLMRGVIEMVDLIVLFAYYINFIPGFSRLKGLSALRMIRLLRVAALLKVERKTSSFGKIMNVLKDKKSELSATLFMAVVLSLMSATTMYYIENEEQPDKFSSVPAAMWWSVASLTTVGYGDVVPITAPGKFLGSIVAFFGVGLFALPAGILGSGFVEEVEKAKKAALKEEHEDEEDVAEEVVNAEEIEAQDIDKMTVEVKSLRTTVENIHAGQRDITEVLQRVCPSLSIPTPSSNKAVVRQASDNDLAAVQESVIVKMDSLRSLMSSKSFGNRR